MIMKKIEDKLDSKINLDLDLKKPMSGFLTKLKVVQI